MLRALLVVACLTAVAVAQPSPQQEAKEHFDLANAAEKDGRYRDAIDEYEKAYALVPHVDVLYNIATDLEHIEEWARAAELYQRYLDERTEPAPDAAAVKRKIRVLRARIPAPPPPPVEPPPEQPSEPPPFNPPPIALVVPQKPQSPWANSPWHLGASYGVGFGDAPTERYLAYGGLRFAHRADLDLVGGSFGRNDYAVGVMGRVILYPGYVAPFLRAAATIGVAKQDASSMAGTRFPFGVEVGGGVAFGVHGRVEVDAVARWVSGGWGTADTTAPSYVNDSFAIGIDLGITFDFALIGAGR
jgi:hypothetical protein